MHTDRQVDKTFFFISCGLSQVWSRNYLLKYEDMMKFEQKKRTK